MKAASWRGKTPMAVLGILIKLSSAQETITGCTCL
jgi:hypothetical protein